MKKIVILRCLKSNDVCTGASCLQAFYDRTGKFKVYDIDENLQLVAFFSCNGCDDVRFQNQKGLEEKLERILALNPSAVHIGDKINEISKYIQAKGVNVIRGTHT